MTVTAVAFAERWRMSATELADPGDDAHYERPAEVVEVIRCFISPELVPVPEASTAER
jgi:hypothetical protein